MYWHNQLTKIGFKIATLDVFNKNNDQSGIDYYFKNKKIEVRVTIYLSGKITMNYWEPDKPRELEFSVNYMNEDYLLVKYIKKFIKKYK